MQLYDSKETVNSVTINKLFKSNVTSVSLREDSLMVAAGEESGRVQVVDTKRKQPLRKYHTHTKPVHALEFLSKQLLVSGSDDKSVQVFDVSTDSIVRQYKDLHTDYIRSLSAISNTSSVLCGSYDGSVSLLDTNNPAPLSVFQHGDPVQDVAAFSNGFSFVSVGGKQAKLWDLRNSTAPVREATVSQKDISQARLALDNRRLLISSYDGHLKVLDTADFQVTHQFNFKQPVMCFDFVSSYSQIGVGLADGSFLVEKKNLQKGVGEEEEPDMFKDFFKSADGDKVVKNYKYFNRGMFEQPQDYTLVQGEAKRAKTKAYDRFLKKFEFKNALLCTLAGKQNDLIMSMLDELVQRNVLRVALKALDLEEMGMVISFIDQRLHDHRYN